MVTIDFSQKLIRHLELYLWRTSEFKLPATGYDLVLLLPISPDSWSDKRTLLLSAPALFRQSRWDTTYSLLSTLRAGLDEEDYLSIFNVDIIEPTAYIVQQVARYSQNRVDGEINAPISLIGGVTNQTITVIKSTVLEHLAYYKFMNIYLTNGERITGKLSNVRPDTVDIKLEFETNSGLKNCLFTEIIRVVSE